MYWGGQWALPFGLQLLLSLGASNWVHVIYGRFMNEVVSLQFGVIYQGPTWN
jgi:hypothetical protein